MVALAQQAALYARLLADIAAKRLPVRRPRSNARVVKRTMSNVKLKRAVHDRPPTPRGAFWGGAGAAAAGLGAPRAAPRGLEATCLKVRQRERIRS